MNPSTEARQQIMARLRRVPIATPQALPDVAGWYASHGRQETPDARIERLRAGLLASHAEVIDVTAGNWMDVLWRVVAAKGVRQLLVGSHSVPEQALLASASPPACPLVRYEQAIEGWKDQLFDGIDASLTMARSAIAETGSLILWPDATEPRLMSLVPPLHIVLLDVRQIHADFHSAMRAEGWQQGLPTNVVLISGPSKTADIQQTLAYGAHGPRELVVLLKHTQAGAV